MSPKYPHIRVRLAGEDGSAFAILRRVTKAMRGGGCSTEEIEAFCVEATADDYDNLLQTCFAWVHCR